MNAPSIHGLSLTLLGAFLVFATITLSTADVMRHGVRPSSSEDEPNNEAAMPPDNDRPPSSATALDQGPPLFTQQEFMMVGDDSCGRCGSNPIRRNLDDIFKPQFSSYRRKQGEEAVPQWEPHMYAFTLRLVAEKHPGILQQWVDKYNDWKHCCVLMQDSE